jgi:flagellar hook protein FlgE
MSLFGSLYTSVSGLNAQSQALSMISDNIANTSTIGYKSNSAQFADLVTQAGGTFSSGGVVTNTVQNIDQQGLLQQTQSSTDLAISGKGFFVVQPTPAAGQGAVYTRAGSFTENSQGYLVNTSGYYLMGWPLNASGALPNATDSLQSLQPINLNSVATTLAPTTTASLNLNLNAADVAAVAPATNFTRSLTVYDSLGGQQTVTMNFTKTASNTWTMALTGGTPAVTSSNAVTFNTDGSIATPNPATVSFGPVDWGNGSDPTQTISVDISKMTQDAAPYAVTSVVQDGQAFGSQSGISVDKSGIVTASYTNGQTRKIYQLPIATFAADSQLSALSGDVYAQTLGSGSYYLNQAGSSGAGTISPSSLEQSNVDLASEFSNMIVTQQAYAANSKVISSANQMLQALLQVQI